MGRTSLAESINVGVFPRLGVVENIACLIKEGSDYLDRACSVSEFRREVWDVNWGSQFPCANGSASDIIFSHALRSAPPRIQVAPDPPASPEKNGTVKGKLEKKVGFTRPQVLHVIRCYRTGSSTASATARRISTRRKLHWLYESVMIVATLGSGAVALLFGLYGTFAAALVSATFQIARSCIVVHTPNSFLLDNESGSIPACMLVANHQNASSWYLFCGDRGVVDGVLNKNMIFSVESRFGKLGTFCLIPILRLLACLQILILTYVAAQKGWDGIGLLAFIIVAWITEDLIKHEDHLASSWARRYDVHFDSRSFEFKGRVSMIGAIQIYKKDPTRNWLDGILVPSERRDLWLKVISEGKFECKDDDPVWDNVDEGVKKFAKDNMARSKTAADVMEKEFARKADDRNGLVV